MRLNVHGYFTSRKRLKKRLIEFKNGQFLMETKPGLVFRGEIRECQIPDMGKKRVLILFNWLCERRFSVDSTFTPIPKWVRLELPLETQLQLEVDYTSYYFQKEGRRIKMWTPQKEVCRFYKQGDNENLLQAGEEFVPCYEEKTPNSGPNV